jgi:hypothetical protein
MVIDTVAFSQQKLIYLIYTKDPGLWRNSIVRIVL